MRAKERILKDKSGKPDPMQRAAGLNREIARLNTPIETAVMTPPFICCNVAIGKFAQAALSYICIIIIKE